MVHAEVESIGRADGVWHCVKVDDRRIAEFRNRDDAEAWCKVWNAFDDPNYALTSLLE